MTLQNSPESSQATSSTVEHAILDRMTERLFKMQKLLQEGRMNQGALQMWVLFLRANLSKLYGKDSDVIQLLQPIKGKLDHQTATEIARISIETVGNYIRTVQDTGKLSFGVRSHGKIFIGHGRSPLWRELKDFLSDRLGLSWDEFNREAVAGLPTFERITQMLSEAEFAFLIMTAEDAHLDRSIHARENVVHEVGLFQGKLGAKKAIILLEDGCEEFSNIVGLSQIRFPKGNISAVFEEIRRVLEREGVSKKA
ncbi:MAG: nucleotide-binding protein [Deltaproteobacteria bacterium]|jgi:predicted nucleotide-binding protein|nr:nucleotide-binding protein [Deltaproteobacteria bacterium]